MKSVLSLDNLIFDEISFVRDGLKNLNSDFDFHFEVSIGKIKNDSSDHFKVTLKMIGEKKAEYHLTISLTGFFSFDSQEKLEDAFKNELIQNNAVAIMMPYLRSQLSLVTAQPNMECVVLPPFNINNMMSDE